MFHKVCVIWASQYSRGPALFSGEKIVFVTPHSMHSFCKCDQNLYLLFCGTLCEFCLPFMLTIDFCLSIRAVCTASDDWLRKHYCIRSETGVRTMLWFCVQSTAFVTEKLGLFCVFGVVMW